MAFQTPFCFKETKPNDCNFFQSPSWSSSKISTFRLFKFSKATGGHVLWVMSHFRKTSIYDLNTVHTYAICIYYGSEFYDKIFAYKFFSESAYANFQISISSKMRGRNIFRLHIRIQNKILHRMIWIAMGLSVIRPRKDGIYWIGSFTPTQSTLIAPRVL